MKVPKKKSSLTLPNTFGKVLETQFPGMTLMVPLHTSTEAQDDLVNPKHYQGAGMQVIDVLRAFLTPEEFKGYLKGNCLKYQLRCEKKGGPVDLDKSGWYQKELRKLLDGSHSTAKPLQ